MDPEDRFHVKIIIEHTDRPAEFEIQSGNHSTDFFRWMWSYLAKMEASHRRHRCISSLLWGILDDNRREISYIVRFVPLKRFEVTMLLKGEHKLPPATLHTDNAAEILPWVENQGRRIIMRTVGLYPCEGMAMMPLAGFGYKETPESLQQLRADFAVSLERWEDHGRKRCGDSYEAMFVRFTSEEQRAE